MLPDNHALVTTVWMLLHALPLLFVAAIWLLFGTWWGVASLVLYVVGIIPYGFFISLPMMGKLFHKPASLYRR